MLNRLKGLPPWAEKNDLPEEFGMKDRVDAFLKKAEDIKNKIL